jgi:hypothetical protein
LSQISSSWTTVDKFMESIYAGTLKLLKTPLSNRCWTI